MGTLSEPSANMEAASSFSDSTSDSLSELESCSELEESLLLEGNGETWFDSLEVLTFSDSFF